MGSSWYSNHQARKVSNVGPAKRALLGGGPGDDGVGTGTADLGVTAGLEDRVLGVTEADNTACCWGWVSPTIHHHLTGHKSINRHARDQVLTNPLLAIRQGDEDRSLLTREISTRVVIPKLP